MRYKIYGDRVKLFDSYAVPKYRYSRELLSIRNLYPTLELWNRSYGSMRREWAAHTLAYNLGIKRSKTKDADLNYTQPWYVKLGYAVVGTIALLVIK